MIVETVHISDPKSNYLLKNGKHLSNISPSVYSVSFVVNRTSWLLCHRQG